jgi:hypothetical protein
LTLDMRGHIDPVFKSIPATRTPKAGAYVGGLWVPDAPATPIPHTVTIQPASDREIESIERGGERIVDARRIYVNDGVLASISPADIWNFDGQRWKCHKLDNRPWRNYCKAIVSRIDNQ